MKKGISLVLALAPALGLTARSADGDDARSAGSPPPVMESPAAGTEAPSAPGTVTIVSLDADREAVELEALYDSQCIAILDMASLDILDVLGVVGGRVVGSVDTSLDYFQSYVIDENMTDLGTIKTVDLEAVVTAQPDMVLIGGRLVKSYDVLSEITPVVYLVTDSELGVVKSVRQNAAIIVSTFGLEDKVDELMVGFDARVQTLVGFTMDKITIVGMCTSGSFNVLDNNDRYSIVSREIGFKNTGVDADINTSTRGNKASFEFVTEKNPDYISVISRDAAIQTDGTQLVQETVKNELVIGTDAYKNDSIVYLTHPVVRYTAKGSIIALDIMLQGLESKLLG